MGDDEVFTISFDTTNILDLEDEPEYDLHKHAEDAPLVRTVSEDRRCRFRGSMTSWQERDSTYDSLHGAAAVNEEVLLPVPHYSHFPLVCIPLKQQSPRVFPDHAPFVLVQAIEQDVLRIVEKRKAQAAKRAIEDKVSAESKARTAAKEWLETKVDWNIIEQRQRKETLSLCRL